MKYHIYFHRGKSKFSNFYYEADNVVEAGKVISFVNCICPNDTLRVLFWATSTSVVEVLDPNTVLEEAFHAS